MTEDNQRGPWGLIGRIALVIGILAGITGVLAYFNVRPHPLSSAAASGAPYYLDDTSSQVEYVGPWHSNSGNTGFYDGTQHFTGPFFGAQPGDYAQLAFVGTQISYYAIVDNHHGDAEVYLDGNYQATVDLYRSTRQGDVLVWSSTDLTRGTHTLKILYDRTKNPMSRDYVVTVDAFYIVP